MTKHITKTQMDNLRRYKEARRNPTGNLHERLQCLDRVIETMRLPGRGSELRGKIYFGKYDDGTMIENTEKEILLSVLNEAKYYKPFSQPVENSSPRSLQELGTILGDENFWKVKPDHVIHLFVWPHLETVNRKGFVTVIANDINTAKLIVKRELSTEEHIISFGPVHAINLSTRYKTDIILSLDFKESVTP